MRKEANQSPMTSSDKEELNLEEDPLDSSEGTEQSGGSMKEEMDDKGIVSSDQESPQGVLEIQISCVESNGLSSSEISSSNRSVAPDGSVVGSQSSRWRSFIGGMLLRKNRSMRRLATFPGATASLETGEERMEVKEIPLDSNEELNPEEDSIDSSNSVEGTLENRESMKPETEDKSIDSSDQESPRGVLEIPISSADSDGGSTTESSSSYQSITSDGSVVESHSLQWRSFIGGMLLRRKGSMRRLSTFPPTIPRSGLRGCLTKIQGDKDRIEDEGSQLELPRGRPSWRSFDYQELAAATDNFSPDKLIGKGGHAEVYKGCLPDSQFVAVKRLTKGESEEERTRDFLSELGIIAHVNHPNAAQLLGFSVEGGLHLVLKFSPHGSLASLLHGTKEGLLWVIRMKIALGIAEGLLYLHEGCQRRIIHRDIKASNILLTHEYEPQISDFGLAKWLPDKWTHHVVFPIEGTFGYLAPEYFMHGVVNEKTDVFAFGVLLLELVTGRKAVDSSRQSLAIWAKPLLEAGKMKELADPSLGDQYNPEELRRVVSVASMCIHHHSTMRPSMNWVVRLLRGEERVEEIARRESMRRPPVLDSSELEDYTCSRYLNDLHRHKQLAMEQ